MFVPLLINLLVILFSFLTLKLFHQRRETRGCYYVSVIFTSLFSLFGTFSDLLRYSTFSFFSFFLLNLAF